MLYPRCAGLDVPREKVVACVRVTTGDDVVREIRTFAPATAGVIACRAGDTSRLHPAGAGGDRGLLEAGLERPER